MNRKYEFANFLQVSNKYYNIVAIKILSMEILSHFLSLSRIALAPLSFSEQANLIRFQNIALIKVLLSLEQLALISSRHI